MVWSKHEIQSGEIHSALTMLREPDPTQWPCLRSGSITGAQRLSNKIAEGLIHISHLSPVSRRNHVSHGRKRTRADLFLTYHLPLVYVWR